MATKSKTFLLIELKITFLDVSSSNGLLIQLKLFDYKFFENYL